MQYSEIQSGFERLSLSSLVLSNMDFASGVLIPRTSIHDYVRHATPTSKPQALRPSTGWNALAERDQAK
ncbi:hypothetical protein VTL71DRAFT_2036, partial [Oculimacula yallundae]